MKAPNMNAPTASPRASDRRASRWHRNDSSRTPNTIVRLLVAAVLAIGATAVGVTARPSLPAAAAAPTDVTVRQLGTDIDGQAANDQSGWSVAISADGNTAIIGAPYNDDGGNNAGQTRIYHWDGTTWTLRGNPINGQAANDESGTSVAISADGNTAIIGAPFNDDGGSDAGQARIYQWDGTAWTQRGNPVNGQAANDQSGWSVAISADGNTAIIGAPFNDDGGSDAGQARIYHWDGTTWTQRGTAINGQAANDFFGWSVAISADGNTAIIGAPTNDDGGSDAGQTRIYHWDGTTWTQRGTAINGQAANDFSGYSVAISADGNTAIIGAYGNDGGGANA